MSSRWDVVQRLFHEVDALPHEERGSYLAHQCGADLELNREVAALLRACDGSDEYLAETLHQAAALVLERPRERIGVYQIVRPLGHGGMGSVYLAVRADDEYRKYVAIKVVRGGGESQEMLRRFRVERQILADLTHPGIGQLLDGGVTEAGSPYLVMEYIAGLPIDQHVAVRKLSLAERLRLFQQVCQAVAYAHRHLVVHCDLKPNNILVSEEGTAKLLDFGTAKLFQPFDAKPSVTRLQDRYLTPEYASPEQIRGAAVSTATDVYALGVVLFELLTAERLNHLEGKSPTECERAICEVDPRKPSAANRELAGDLDSIVLKALAKEPERRYESVLRLDEDIERYLTGRPVQARPNTWVYYAGKFAQRNRVAVAGALLLIFSLAVGVIGTAIAERRAIAAQQKAQQSLEQMLEAANTSLFGIHDSIANLPGSTQARSLVVRNVLGYLEPLAKQNAGNSVLQRELAEAYERLSDIQFRDGPGYLGDSTGALASANQALRLREELKDDLHQAGDLRRIATIERITRNLTSSRQYSERAIALYEAAAARNPRDRDTRQELALAYQDLAAAERLSGAPDAALKHVDTAIAVQEHLLEDAPGDQVTRQAIEKSSITRSRIFEAQFGDKANALKSGRRALELAEGLQAQFPQNRQYQTDLASASGELGNLNLGKDNAQALHWYQRSFALVAGLAASDPADARMRRSVAVHGTNLGLALDKLGRTTEAEEWFRKSLGIHEGLSRLDPSNGQTQDDIAYTAAMLGTLLTQSGRLEEGAAKLGDSIQIREGLVTRNPGNVEFQFRLARTWSALGQAQVKQANCQGAVSALQKSEGLLKALAGKMEVGAELKTVREKLAGCRNTQG